MELTFKKGKDMRLANTQSFIFLLFILTIGCNDNSMRILVENRTGNNLKNVILSGNGKSFEFGVVGDGKRAGFHTAERLFGNKFPENVTLDFETIDGECFSREIKLVIGAKGQTLRVLVDDKLDVTAHLEK